MQANLQMNQSNLSRQQKLRDAGVGAAQQFDQAAAQLRNNHANIQQMENQVKKIQLLAHRMRTSNSSHRDAKLANKINEYFI